MNPVWTRVLFKERKVWSNLSLSELNNINYGFEISDNLFAGVGGGGEREIQQTLTREAQAGFE